MSSSDFVRFVKISVILSVGAFGLAAVVSPPDPFIQLLYFAVLLLAVPFVAYILT